MAKNIGKTAKFPALMSGLTDNKNTETYTDTHTDTDALITPKSEEKRSQRINLTVKPSVYNAVKMKCDRYGISVSDCVNQFFEKWIQE